jgi:hypothetical protein
MFDSFIGLKSNASSAALLPVAASKLDSCSSILESSSAFNRVPARNPIVFVARRSNGPWRIRLWFPQASWPRLQCCEELSSARPDPWMSNADSSAHPDDPVRRVSRDEHDKNTIHSQRQVRDKDRAAGIESIGLCGLCGYGCRHRGAAPASPFAFHSSP